MKGRRLPDTLQGDLPEEVRAGDYWKVLSRGDGKPLRSEFPDNLTGTVWMIAAPLGTGSGFGLGTLRKHTVREEEDGTISVRQGDGSSNSILVQRANGDEYHGFIEKGEWS